MSLPSSILVCFFCFSFRSSNQIRTNREHSLHRRKITRALTRISLGLQEKLYLGNLDARRDWGYAGDYVEAMWMMLQAPQAGDYVIATGESHSIRDFLDLAARYCGLDWHHRVEPDLRYFRPSEVDHLLGDASKARAELGWTPSMSFDELVKLMVESDMELARQELTLTNAGHRVVMRGRADA